jgi:hypothetical protein
MCPVLHIVFLFEVPDDSQSMSYQYEKEEYNNTLQVVTFFFVCSVLYIIFIYLHIQILQYEKNKSITGKKSAVRKKKGTPQTYLIYIKTRKKKTKKNEKQHDQKETA